MPHSKRKTSTSKLRQAAEQRLKEEPLQSLAHAKNEADPARLLHELQVHQLQLEMQNEELLQARETIYGILKKYSDLYDFAPVGYLTLDAQLKITNANLTAATLLGVDRAQLVEQNFTDFFDADGKRQFAQFFDQILAGSAETSCEVRLIHKQNHTDFHANINAGVDHSVDSITSCNITISDLTAIKQAEKAKQKLTKSHLINEQLNEEILRRKIVEKALRRGEKHLSQLLDQSSELRQQLQKLSNKVLLDQEKERKKLSCDLLHVVSKRLTEIHSTLSTKPENQQLPPEQLNATISHAIEALEQMIQQVQEYANEIYPISLDQIGLVPTLRAYLENFTQRTGIQTHLTASAEVPHLDSTRRTGLFRVTQEALTNIEHHARARSVIVELREETDSLCLKIHDDGCSFEVEDGIRASYKDSLGLLGMRARVEMMQGYFHITSSSAKGTTVRANIPIKESTK